MKQSKLNEDIHFLKRGYTKPIRIFEVLAIISYTLLALWSIYYCREFIISQPIKLILYLIIAWVFSDFITGGIHWIFDTWGKYSWPIIGNLFVRPFLEHHISPEKMTEHDWIETNGSSMFVGFLVLGSAIIITDSKAIIMFGLFISFWGSLTNQFHKWTHENKIPKWATILQKCGIVISTKKHDLHHYGEFDRSYCITNGIMNPILDKFGFFKFLEGTIQKITKQTPRDNELS